MVLFTVSCNSDCKQGGLCQSLVSRELSLPCCPGIIVRRCYVSPHVLLYCLVFFLYRYSHLFPPLLSTTSNGVHMLGEKMLLCGAVILAGSPGLSADMGWFNKCSEFVLCRFSVSLFGKAASDNSTLIISSTLSCQIAIPTHDHSSVWPFVRFTWNLSNQNLPKMESRYHYF